ncbi:MAG: DUF2490 domain-containing protein [Acinetobacter sp.]|nr:DUF2490 domain-containing protein [Acinetobacter sp.]
MFSASVSAEVEEDGRLWLNQTLQGNVSDQVGWYFEVQERFRDEARDFDQLLVRPALKYKLSANSSLWLGYAYVSTHPEKKDTIHENRVWQQYMHQFDSWHGLNFISRTRLEQRWSHVGDDTGYRLRQLIRMNYPISDTGINLVLWDEYFINLNNADWLTAKGFDQNRAFIGTSLKLNDKSKFELGYLNQHINTATADKSNHILSTVFLMDF